MTEFWAARTARERLLLGVLGAGLLAYLLAVALWQPLTRQRDATMADIARYTRLQPALVSIASGPDLGGQPVSADLPIPAVLAETANAYGLTIQRLQPSGTAAEVTLADAAFADVLAWVDVLERDHALHIIAVTMTRRPQPGHITATLTVGR